MSTPHKKDKEALGKGIRSLLQSIDADLNMAAIRRPLAVFTFTGANKGREKVAKDEGILFRGQGGGHRLTQPALVAAHHRIRKLLAGAYWRRNFSVDIFTLSSPERRQHIVAREVGFGWPAEELA